MRHSCHTVSLSMFVWYVQISPNHFHSPLFNLFYFLHIPLELGRVWDNKTVYRASGVASSTRNRGRTTASLDLQITLTLMNAYMGFALIWAEYTIGLYCLVCTVTNMPCTAGQLLSYRQEHINVRVNWRGLRSPQAGLGIISPYKSRKAAGPLTGAMYTGSNVSAFKNHLNYLRKILKGSK